MKLPTLSRQQINNIVVLVCLGLLALYVLANVFGSDRVAGWIEWGLGQVTSTEAPLIEGDPK